MLNRRTLRAKIMQSLFAFEQCKEANNELAIDLIDQRFSPNLNSMEVQDKPQLKKQNKEAKALYIKNFKKTDTVVSQDEAVSKTVAEALTFNENQTKKDFNFLRKNLAIEVEKINHWYYHVLGLVLAFAALARSDKKSDYSNFSDNPFILALKNDTVFNALLLKTNTGWENEHSLVQAWFRAIIKTDNTFTEYIKKDSPSVDEHKTAIKYIVRKLILGDTAINDYFLERNIHWTEDHDIVKSLVEKTIKSIDENGKIQIQKLSMDWEDDLVFMNTLFEKTTQLDTRNKELISKNTRNWEVDRLPLTDRIILEMAITELINFPSIPVKVSINEYIELTKQYSTPKSAKFVNGILDVIAKDLVASGHVKKSGRGLIDNK